MRGQNAGKEEKNLRGSNFEVTNSNWDRTKANLGYSHTTKTTLAPLAPFGYSHTTKERLRLCEDTTLLGQIVIARRQFESLKEQRLNFYSICQKILTKGRVRVFISPQQFIIIWSASYKRENKG